MVRTFIQTREFSRNWDKLGFKDEDLRKLELELLENSDLHPVIKGTGGLRKIKFLLQMKGKVAVPVFAMWILWFKRLFI